MVDITGLGFNNYDPENMTNEEANGAISTLRNKGVNNEN